MTMRLPTRSELTNASHSAGTGEEESAGVATYGWHWAADTLAAVGAEEHLARPLEGRAFSYRRFKNDEKDAADRKSVV